MLTKIMLLLVLKVLAVIELTESIEQVKCALLKKINPDQVFNLTNQCLEGDNYKSEVKVRNYSDSNDTVQTEYTTNTALSPNYLKNTTLEYTVEPSSQNQPVSYTLNAETVSSMLEWIKTLVDITGNCNVTDYSSLASLIIQNSSSVNYLSTTPVASQPTTSCSSVSDEGKEMLLKLVYAGLFVGFTILIGFGLSSLLGIGSL